MERAIQIVTKAVEEDEKRNYKDAYHLYCEGLQYFVPLITAEEDASKREHLQKQAITYMQRAEEIKRSAKQAYLLQRQNSASAPNESNTSTPETTSCGFKSKARATENNVLAAINPTSSFKELRKAISEETQFNILAHAISFRNPFQMRCLLPHHQFNMLWTLHDRLNSIRMNKISHQRWNHSQPPSICWCHC